MATESSISQTGIVLTPEQIEMVCALQGVGLNPADAVISIENPYQGEGTFEWAAQVDADWLILEPHTGICKQGKTDEIRLRIDAESLEPGTYRAMLTVSSSNPEMSGSVRVILTVLPVRISPPYHWMLVMEGGPVSGEPLTIGNPYESDLTWSAASDADWLGLLRQEGDEGLRQRGNGRATQKAQGVLEHNLEDKVSLIARADDYNPERTYNAAVNISVNDSPTEPILIPVTLTVLRGKRLIDSLPGLYHYSNVDRVSTNGTPGAGGIDTNEDDAGFSLDGFLRIFESILSPLERVADNLSYYFDPTMTPEDMLSWIARWLDFILDPSWPIERRRELVKSAIELYKWRGTRRGLQRYLEVYAGVKPDIFEDIGGFALDEYTWLEENTFLGEGSSHIIRIRLNIPQTQHVQIEKVRQIIEKEKPAHLAYTLNVTSPNGRARTDGVRSEMSATAEDARV